MSDWLGRQRSESHSDISSVSSSDAIHKQLKKCKTTVSDIERKLKLLGELSSKLCCCFLNVLCRGNVIFRSNRYSMGVIEILFSKRQRSLLLSFTDENNLFAKLKPCHFCKKGAIFKAWVFFKL